MDWVIDCSCAAALFLPDESSSKIKSFISDLSEEPTLWIPTLWWYEMTNVLTVAERKKRINHSEVLKIISLFDQFNLNTDNSNGAKFSNRIYELSRLYKLTAYDATYLELSIRKGAGLASFDNQLLNSAKEAGVKIFDL